MIDAAQTVLLLVVVVLTVLLVILGVQVFYILRELRQTVVKANRVLDDTAQITESVSAPISSLSSIIAGVKTGAAIAQIFKKHSGKSKGKAEMEEEDEG